MLMTLEEMKNIDIRTVDPATLVDIRDVVINTDLSKAERIKEYKRQVGNPYCFKCGNVVVKVGFADTAVTIDERIENYLRTM